jgi:hypothetical protein
MTRKLKSIAMLFIQIRLSIAQTVDLIRFNSKYISVLSFADFSILCGALLSICKNFKFYVFSLFDLNPLS